MSGKCSEGDHTQQKVKLPVVIVLGVDISGTMSGYKPLSNRDHLTPICSYMNARQTGAVICVGRIGNPTDEGFQRLYISSVPVVDEKATMSERGRQRKHAEEVKTLNRENLESFLNEVSLEWKNDRMTCINKFCSDASKLLNEPQFNGYQKILILYTDGFEDANGDNRVEPLCASFADEVAIFTIGWKNEKKITHSGHYDEFADIEGVVSYLLTI